MHAVRKVSWEPIMKEFIHHETDFEHVLNGSTEERRLLNIELGFQQHSG